MTRTVRIAKGHDVPYPEPTSPTATLIGRANRRADTKCEVLLRSELHRRGLRFRKDHLVHVPDGTKARVDVCFTRSKVAVFVDGCFWHSCPEHLHLPRSNRDYWVPKLAANVARDERVTASFERVGWRVLRVWEHEDVGEAADRIELAVRDRRPEG